MEDIWRNIQQTFLVLKDWFEDHEYYHKIGYLIASGSMTLQKIFELSKDKTKKEFRDSLDSYIKSSIAIKGTSIIKYSDFARRIRIVNNLIQNSGDEVSDRTDRNRMPAILAQTEAIIATGKIDDSIEKSFNVNQLSEEKKKIEFLDDNPGQAKTMFELEDHPMLKGQKSRT